MMINYNPPSHNLYKEQIVFVLESDSVSEVYAVARLVQTCLGWQSLA